MKKRRFSKEILIGLFTASIIIFGYLGLNWLKNKNLFSGDYTIVAVYDYADGIEPTASVMARGFKIGTVEEVILDLDKEKVTLVMNIFGSYKLYDNATAIIAASSLLGGTAVEISMEGTSTKRIAQGDTIKTKRVPGMMDALAADLPEMLGDVKEMMAKLNRITTTLESTLDADMAQSLKATVGNIEGLTAELNNTVRSQSGNIKSAIENIEGLSASLLEMAPSIQTSVQNIEDVTNSLSESAPQLIMNAVTSLGNLSTMLSKINKGEGSAGQLLNDKELYDNMSETLGNLSVLLEDLKANPKKYINVSVFGGKK